MEKKEKKKSLLLDVEEVIFFGGFLQAVNDFLQTNFVIDDFKDYYIDSVAIPEDRFGEFNQFVRERNMFANPQILPYAIEMTKLLCEYYEVFLCTDSINPFDVDGSARNFIDKFKALRDILPFIKPDHYIFTSDKSLFNAYAQVDDRLEKMDNDVEVKILFPSYHNKEVTEEQLKNIGAIRAGDDWREGWKEVGKILIPDYERATKKIFHP
ncbi:MAG: hypothetical protein K2L98_02490 [Bacilli bacterium]|nr:hypothetical protein [Bacilli bacterium]